MISNEFLPHNKAIQNKHFAIFYRQVILSTNASFTQHLHHATTLFGVLSD